MASLFIIIQRPGSRGSKPCKLTFEPADIVLKRCEIGAD